MVKKRGKNFRIITNEQIKANVEIRKNAEVAKTAIRMAKYASNIIIVWLIGQYSSEIIESLAGKNHLCRYFSRPYNGDEKRVCTSYHSFGCRNNVRLL
jgi:hypothetical protein